MLAAGSLHAFVYPRPALRLPLPSPTHGTQVRHLSSELDESMRSQDAMHTQLLALQADKTALQVGRIWGAGVGLGKHCCFLLGVAGQHARNGSMPLGRIIVRNSDCAVLGPCPPGGLDRLQVQLADTRQGRAAEKKLLEERLAAAEQQWGQRLNSLTQQARGWHDPPHQNT